MLSVIVSVADEVIELVARAAGVDPAVIFLHSELWSDLRLGGDDMLELFLDLQKKYDLNLDGLHLPTYSPDEDDVLIEQIADWVKKKLHVPPSSNYKTLTVADLIAVVERKSWGRQT
jgi:acyl carrier protein